MAEIRPFHGVRYNQSQVNDLAAVICPPYDIITPQMQQELCQRSEHNFVRLEFGQDLPQDSHIDNKYIRASSTLERWLKQGILKVDDTPAIYLHDQYFSHQGNGYRRRGIIALVRLEEWSKMVVRPHEGTLSNPKDDRLNLMWALNANTSSIFGLYEDRKQQISSLLAAQAQSEPMMEIRDVNGEGHAAWAITETETIERRCGCLAQQPLYIADGHHRYESALTYHRERHACDSSLSGDKPFDFVMMTLVDLSDPGLVILPAHRLVRGISNSALGQLMAKLKTFFEIEELPLTMPDVWNQVDGLLAEEANEIKLVLFGLDKEHLLILRLRDFAAASQMMPYFHSELYKRLDVSIVDHVILEELLGLTRDKEGASLAYSYDRLDSVRKVFDREYQLAFLLSPIKAEMIKGIADVGDRMPKKSTYFYPKLPAGLVFYRLD